MTAARESLCFGVAGIPNSCPEESSFKAIDCLISAGLEALELEFVHGLRMNQETATQIKLKAGSQGIKLSAHAPYFINLNAEDKGKIIQSQDLLLNSLRLAAVAGASDLVFHAGYYGKKSSEETYRTIKLRLKEIISIARSEKIPVALRIETMGKKSQFGSLDEVINLCREIDHLFPCLDFAHIFAREGRVNSYSEFHRVLSKVEKKLGHLALQKAHIHISGVKFNQAGELKHLNLNESDFHYYEWLQALLDFGVKGT
ncbi:MAG: TIM barrel protein, partial [Candidatus Saccharicenans sp.]